MRDLPVLRCCNITMRTLDVSIIASTCFPKISQDFEKKNALNHNGGKPLFKMKRLGAFINVKKSVESEYYYGGSLRKVSLQGI